MRKERSKVCETPRQKYSGNACDVGLAIADIAFMLSLRGRVAQNHRRTGWPRLRLGEASAPPSQIQGYITTER